MKPTTAKVVRAEIDFPRSGLPTARVHFRGEDDALLIYECKLPVADRVVDSRHLAGLATLRGIEVNELAELLAYSWIPNPESAAERLADRITLRMAGVEAEVHCADGRVSEILSVSKSLRDLEPVEDARESTESDDCAESGFGFDVSDGESVVDEFEPTDIGEPS